MNKILAAVIAVLGIGISNAEMTLDTLHDNISGESTIGDIKAIVTADMLTASATTNLVKESADKSVLIATNYANATFINSTNGYTKSQTDEKFLMKSGGQMSGDLTMDNGKDIIVYQGSQLGGSKDGGGVRSAIRFDEWNYGRKPKITFGGTGYGYPLGDGTYATSSLIMDDTDILTCGSIQEKFPTVTNSYSKSESNERFLCVNGTNSMTGRLNLGGFTYITYSEGQKIVLGTDRGNSKVYVDPYGSDGKTVAMEEDVYSKYDSDNRFLKTDGYNSMIGSISFEYTNLWDELSCKGGIALGDYSIDDEPYLHRGRYFSTGGGFTNPSCGIVFWGETSDSASHYSRMRFSNCNYDTLTGGISDLIPDGTKIMTQKAVAEAYPIVTNSYTKQEIDSRFADGTMTLTNSPSTSSIILKSGKIAYANMPNNGIFSAAIDFSTDTEKSGDSILYLTSPNGGKLSVMSIPEGSAIRSIKNIDWQTLDDGENVFRFTKIRNENGTNTILIASESLDAPYDGLKFTANSANSTIALNKVGSPNSVGLQYSKNGATWKTYGWSGNNGNVITLSDVGDKVYFRAITTGNSVFSKDELNYYKFVLSGSVSASGNVQSLLDASNSSMSVPSYGYYGLFSGCSQLTGAPTLPATLISDYCYSAMFENCTALTVAPVLPATTVAEGCYDGMFAGCTAISSSAFTSSQAVARSTATSIIKLPAMSMETNCYRRMFCGCTTLLNPPSLPATKLAYGCYESMFSNCTLLAKSPSLMATELAESCYKGMFSRCPSMSNTPNLPAMALAESCYESMFSGCSSLSSAPNFPATNLASNCYQKMFDDTELVVTANMSGIESGGYIPDTHGVLASDHSITITYNKLYGGLCFTANKDGSTVMLQKIGSPAAATLEYSTDSFTWSDYTFDTNILLANAGDKVWFKAGPAGNSQFSSGSSARYTFKMSGSISASGNIQSLLDATLSRTSVPANCFYYLFEYCTALTDPPEMPATELNSSCYFCMFNGCTSLKRAPYLPATKFQNQSYQYANSCYAMMFYGCSSLKDVPDFPTPISRLSSSSHNAMFYGCTSLVKAPNINATSVADSCFAMMFYGCSSLKYAPELPATTMYSYCYDSMFQKCASLENAPELPATMLSNGCYQYMFSGCKKLEDAPELPAQYLASSCYKQMFQQCSYVTNVYMSGITSGKYVPATHGSLATDHAITVLYQQKPGPYRGLCFTANTAGSTVELRRSGSPYAISLEYKVNDSEWASYVPSSTGAITLQNVGDKVWFRAGTSGNANFSKSAENRYWFTMSGSIAASGNIQSLLDQTLKKMDVPASSFYDLFFNCSSLTSAPLLPATTLSKDCYSYMFERCTSLTKAPALPATTLAVMCYYSMFYGCSSLSEPPALPATSLAVNCYGWMFGNCTSLETAPTLAAQTLVDSGYGYMFKGCSNLKTITSRQNSLMDVLDG